MEKASDSLPQSSEGTIGVSVPPLHFQKGAATPSRIFPDPRSRTRHFHLTETEVHVTAGSTREPSRNSSTRMPSSSTATFAQFIARQEAFVTRKAEHLEAAQRQREESKELAWRTDCTFTPRILMRKKGNRSARATSLLATPGGGDPNAPALIDSPRLRSASLELSAHGVRSAPFMAAMEYVSPKKHTHTQSLRRYTDSKQVRLRRSSSSRSPPPSSPPPHCDLLKTRLRQSPVFSSPLDPISASVRKRGYQSECKEGSEAMSFRVSEPLSPLTHTSAPLSPSRVSPPFWRTSHIQADSPLPSWSTSSGTDSQGVSPFVVRWRRSSSTGETNSPAPHRPMHHNNDKDMTYYNPPERYTLEDSSLPIRIDMYSPDGLTGKRRTKANLRGALSVEERKPNRSVSPTPPPPETIPRATFSSSHVIRPSVSPPPRSPSTEEAAVHLLNQMTADPWMLFDWSSPPTAFFPVSCHVCATGDLKGRQTTSNPHTDTLSPPAPHTRCLERQLSGAASEFSDLCSTPTRSASTEAPPMTEVTATEVTPTPDSMGQSIHAAAPVSSSPRDSRSPRPSFCPPTQRMGGWVNPGQLPNTHVCSSAPLRWLAEWWSELARRCEFTSSRGEKQRVGIRLRTSASSRVDGEDSPVSSAEEVHMFAPPVAGQLSMVFSPLRTALPLMTILCALDSLLVLSGVVVNGYSDMCNPGVKSGVMTSSPQFCVLHYEPRKKIYPRVRDGVLLLELGQLSLTTVRNGDDNHKEKPCDCDFDCEEDVVLRPRVSTTVQGIIETSKCCMEEGATDLFGAPLVPFSEFVRLYYWLRQAVQAL